MKIVVTHPFPLFADQRKRLESFGDVTYYDTVVKDGDDWLERVQGADVICTYKKGLRESYDQLSDVFITCPFVDVGCIDFEIADARNIVVKNAPGCNKKPVSQWIVAMVLLFGRQFLNSLSEKHVSGGQVNGIAGKKVTILGKGNIGECSGEYLEMFGMDVSYFTRNDDLTESCKDADFVISTLGAGKQASELINPTFFSNLKKGVYFISITEDDRLDCSALLEAIDKGTVAGAALDCEFFDLKKDDPETLEKILTHPNIVTTDSIASPSEDNYRVAYDMMIDNIENYLTNK